MKVCVVIPTYENPRTIEKVVDEASAFVSDVIVVDDGSGPEARGVSERLARDGRAIVVFRDHNGGKGAAVKTGLQAARERGFTHAVQIDADGQHTASDIPKFVEAATNNPNALVLGQPIFDASAPRGRRIARQITVFFCALETASRAIGDPLCGFRLYPVAAALQVSVGADAMDFDPEIAVRLVWAGHPVLHVPTRVRYFSATEGGVSHYALGRDTFLISWMHTRLCLTALLRLVSWPVRRLAG